MSSQKEPTSLSVEYTKFASGITFWRITWEFNCRPGPHSEKLINVRRLKLYSKCHHAMNRFLVIKFCTYGHLSLELEHNPLWLPSLSWIRSSNPLLSLWETVPLTKTKPNTLFLIKILFSWPGWIFLFFCRFWTENVLVIFFLDYSVWHFRFIVLMTLK